VWAQGFGWTTKEVGSPRRLFSLFARLLSSPIGRAAPMFARSWLMAQLAPLASAGPLSPSLLSGLGGGGGCGGRGCTGNGGGGFVAGGSMGSPGCRLQPVWTLRRF